MKRKSTLSVGPGASSLILIFVVLAMAVLSVLTLISSRNDTRLSTRAVQVAEGIYELNEKAEEAMRDLDGILQAGPENETMDACLARVGDALPADAEILDDIVSMSVTDGQRSMECAWQIREDAVGTYSLAWMSHRLLAGTGEEWEEDEAWD